jgi:hypothetical protein
MVMARWQASIVDDAGNIVSAPSIEVRRETGGAPLAALFSDRDGVVPLGNPFAAGADGFAAFHVAGGAYRITATQGAFSRTWRYVAIGTAGELDGDRLATVRERLTGTRTYFVRTDGNDGNDGLSNSAGGAFATLNRARDAILALDTNGHTVIIKLGNSGIFTSPLDIGTTPVGGGLIVVEGDTAAPQNTIIQTTSAPAINLFGSVRVLVRHLELRTVTAGACLRAASGGALLEIGPGVRFGACAQEHINVAPHARVFCLNNAYAIVGNATRHFSAARGGFIELSGATITLSAGLTFTIFAAAFDAGIISVFNTTFSSNVATGQRYNGSLNALIQTFGGGANLFPGSTAGAVATGAQYV